MGEKCIDSENKCGEEDRPGNTCPSLGGHGHKQALREVRKAAAGRSQPEGSSRARRSICPAVAGSSAPIILGLPREVSSQKGPLCLCILCGSVAVRRLPALAEERQPQCRHRRPRASITRAGQPPVSGTAAGTGSSEQGPAVGGTASHRPRRPAHSRTPDGGSVSLQQQTPTVRTAGGWTRLISGNRMCTTKQKQRNSFIL